MTIATLGADIVSEERGCWGYRRGRAGIYTVSHGVKTIRPITERVSFSEVFTHDWPTRFQPEANSPMMAVCDPGAAGNECEFAAVNGVGRQTASPDCFIIRPSPTMSQPGRSYTSQIL
jgi:hypothetical protein